MNIGQWLLLEERLRQAKDIETLQVILVNLLQQVFPYQQAILFNISSHHQFKIMMASNISEVDHHSKTVQWLEKKFLPWVNKHILDPSYITLEQIHLKINEHYDAMAGCVYLPLKSPQMSDWGLILWVNSEPSKQLIEFAPLMVSTITHAWEKLNNEKSFHHKKPIEKDKIKMGIGIGALAFFVLFFMNITETSLANAEVSPKQPLLIAPSINGAISKINVEPNSEVKPGTALFELDDISIRNKLEEAEQSLNVANQKYLKAYRHAFTDADSRDELKVLQQEKEQAQVLYEYQKSLLERTLIKAPIAGVVLYSDPKDWLGKPVNIGEKVMLLANPNDKEITFWIPMDNMIDVNSTLEVKFFPNESPTDTYYAKIEYINPIAEARPDGTLAYFGVARLSEKDVLRLGEKGALKVYGKKVSIFNYLFKRPLRYLRQHLGV